MKLKEEIQYYKDIKIKDLVNKYYKQTQDMGEAIRLAREELKQFGDIWTWEGAREYEISGLCEHCFVKIFEEKK